MKQRCAAEYGGMQAGKAGDKGDRKGHLQGWGRRLRGQGGQGADAMETEAGNEIRDLL